MQDGTTYILTLFRTERKSEPSLSNKGARYVFKVLVREASFARAIRISTLPTRLNSLASGVSMLDDMMMTEFLNYEKWDMVSVGKLTIEKKRCCILRYYNISVGATAFDQRRQADAACASDILSWSDMPYVGISNLRTTLVCCAKT